MLLLSRSTAAPTGPEQFLKPKGPHLSGLAAHYESIASELEEAPESHTVTLLDGKLVVDGQHVQNPRFQYDTVSWSEKTSAFATSGCLHAIAGGTKLTGVITRGKDEHSAAPTFVTFALADLVFQTQVRSAASDQRRHDWAAGPPLTLGMAFVNGLLQPNAKLNDVDVDIADLRPAPNSTNAVVDVAIKPGEDGPGQPFEHAPWPVPYASLLTLSLDGESFDGTMVEYEGGPPIQWRGTAPDTPATLHAAAARSAEPAVALELSFMDLLSLSTTGASDIAKRLFDDYVKYGMADEWRDQLFGFAKPALDGETAALYNQYSTLFTDHASDIAILRELSTISSDQGGPSTAITADQQRALDYFFQLPIMKITGYNEVSDHLTQIAWVRATPNERLRDYIASPVTPSWGQQLHDAWTSDRALTAAAYAYVSDYDLTPINKNADLLLALSPARDRNLPTKDGEGLGDACTLATLYHTKVLSAIGPQAAPLIQMAANDTDAKQDYADWMASWFSQMLVDLGNRVDDPNIPPAKQAVYRAAQIELQEMQRVPGGMRALAFEIASGVQQIRGSRSNPSGFLGKMQNWLADSKLAQGAKKIILTASVGYSMNQVIAAFNNWSSLDDRQKSQTIIMTSELPFDMLGLAADLDLPAAFTKLMGYLGKSKAVAVVERSLVFDVAADENVFSRLARWLGKALGTEGSEEANFIIRFFGKNSKLMKGFGVLAAAAGCGYSAYQIYEDRHGDDTTLALDSLQLIANTAMLVGAMVAEESALAVLGPVGAVLGVVLMIVSLAIPPPKPESPADQYMDKRGNAALAALDKPPKDWHDPNQ
jgi:hypothetical protein